MTMTEDQLGDAVRSAIEDDDTFTVDDVVAGGRRRARTRRVTGIGAGLAAAAATAGIVIGSLTIGGHGVAMPADPMPAVRAGCTLKPETCDPAVIDRWAARHGLKSYPEGERAHFMPGRVPTSPSPLGYFPPSSQHAIYPFEQDGRHLSASVRIAPDDATAQPMWEALTPGRRTTIPDDGTLVGLDTVEVLPGIVARRAAITERSGVEARTWVIRATADHGAVLVSADAGVVDDAMAIDLITHLLTEPPKH